MERSTWTSSPNMVLTMMPQSRHRRRACQMTSMSEPSGRPRSTSSTSAGGPCSMASASAHVCAWARTDMPGSCAIAATTAWRNAGSSSTMAIRSDPAGRAGVQVCMACVSVRPRLSPVRGTDTERK
ncbi:Uncharacterised protein [Bordetella pertussis]|nr:Uncharacterised protein [Bordetella pertussis]